MLHATIHSHMALDTPCSRHGYNPVADMQPNHQKIIENTDLTFDDHEENVICSTAA